MPRGQHYYNPITQVPEFQPDETDQTRIEMYRHSLTEKWEARKIGSNGLIVADGVSSHDHDWVQREAERVWPDLMIYMVENEREDSTWTGMGPSPRIWQAQVPPGTASAMVAEAAERAGRPRETRHQEEVPLDEIASLVRNGMSHPEGTSNEEEAALDELLRRAEAAGNEIGLEEAEISDEAFQIRGLAVETPGQYILGADVVKWLHLLADQMEAEQRAGPWHEAVRSAADLIEESLGG